MHDLCGCINMSSRECSFFVVGVYHVEAVHAELTAADIVMFQDLGRMDMIRSD